MREKLSVLLYKDELLPTFDVDFEIINDLDAVFLQQFAEGQGRDFPTSSLLDRAVSGYPRAGVETHCPIFLIYRCWNYLCEVCESRVPRIHLQYLNVMLAGFHENQTLWFEERVRPDRKGSKIGSQIDYNIRCERGLVKSGSIHFIEQYLLHDQDIQGSRPKHELETPGADDAWIPIEQQLR